ncbi:PREDICTED: uncharacterized protein LOC106114205 isoform X1 [Papilio xuthus]|uniref:Uncharacterized protein LOC106114205 isoform X1 n=1 Tax=Papilio xuthus TaxID=66420 RepID=A0AAJ7E4T9_PAPXU|nr:PREDICTED: uncharacterized protein LOC106114205 isoform X1 [Papilio xuthus]
MIKVHFFIRLLGKIYTMVQKVIHIILLACYLDIIWSAPQEQPSLDNELNLNQNVSSENNIVATDGSGVFNVGNFVYNNITNTNKQGLLTGIVNSLPLPNLLK